MPTHPMKIRELEEEIATTREVAERVSAALDIELRQLAERARASGAESTLAEVDADLAAAGVRLDAVRRKKRELFLRTEAAMSAIDVDAMQALKEEAMALRLEEEPIDAEIRELKALRAELQHSAH